MALTVATLPAGGSVQLDDGTAGSVWVQNQGERNCVIEPGAVLLRASQVLTVPVVYGTPLMAYGSAQTTLAFQVAALAVPSGLVVDGGSA